jgi:hypothetical protein
MASKFPALGTLKDPNTSDPPQFPHSSLPKKCSGVGLRKKEDHAMSTDVTKKSPTAVTSDPQDLEHQIRLRAYELYEARGGEDGHEVED